MHFFLADLFTFELLMSHCRVGVGWLVGYPLIYRVGMVVKKTGFFKQI
jgi:hypothetical protein